MISRKFHLVLDLLAPAATYNRSLTLSWTISFAAIFQPVDGSITGRLCGVTTMRHRLDRANAESVVYRYDGSIKCSANEATARSYGGLSSMTPPAISSNDHLYAGRPIRFSNAK